MIQIKKISIFIILLFLTISFSKVSCAYPNNKVFFSFDESDEKVVYLTFDDGYSYTNTKKIFEILKERNIKATFFLTGDFINDAGSLVNEMDLDNQIIGNHTWSHKSINKMSNNELTKEIKRFEKRFIEITGHEPIKYFRPPMGHFTNEKAQILCNLGYRIFFWNNTYADYNTKLEYSKEKTFNAITKNVKPGDIILLHTMNKYNIEALPSIIDYLLKNGYEIKNLNYLVDKRK